MWVFSVQGIKAREILHANMEKIIEEKMERQQTEEEHYDAFDYMLSSAKELGQELSIQELKVPQIQVLELMTACCIGPALIKDHLTSNVPVN